MAKKDIWKFLQTKYKVILHNENKLENVMGSHVTILGIIVTLLLLLIFFVALSFVIAVYSPLREYLPGYLNSEMRNNLANTALKLDSLQMEVTRQNVYITNIQDIFRGEVKPDTVKSIDSLAVIRSEELLERSQREEQFVREFEEKEKFNLTSQAATVSDIKGLSLYSPARGTVVTKFNPIGAHYGIDIAANPNESVLNILDGTVIFSDYTATDRYVITIQHNQDLTSVYKNCKRMLVKAGDKVMAGEVIATLGNADEGENENCLHIELWYKGRPLDPNLYIAF